MKTLVPMEMIEGKILLIRSQKVMLDRDLAQLYGVETRALNQAVRRNVDRFPEDFMFPLTREEIMRISQFVISSAHPEVKTLKFSKSVMAFTALTRSEKSLARKFHLKSQRTRLTRTRGNTQTSRTPGSSMTERCNV